MDARSVTVPRDELRRGTFEIVPGAFAATIAGQMGAGTTPLARRQPRASVAGYRLELCVAAAIDRFRRDLRLPILSEDEAKLPPSGVAYAELRPDGFVLRWPRMRPPGGLASVGPCIVGILVPTDEGCRVELRFHRFSPTPSQRLAITGTAVMLVIGLIATIHAGASGLALLAALIVAAYSAHRVRATHADELELVAHVQRIFGPIALGDGEREPYRLAASADR